MNKSDILEFINSNPVFYLSTIYQNEPFVRAMMLMKADENGVIFNTGITKDLHKHIQINSKVEMCFYDSFSNRQVRLRGNVELIDDINVKNEILEKLPFLKPWVEKAGYGILAPYILKKGQATFWSMESNFNPKSYIDF